VKPAKENNDSGGVQAENAEEVPEDMIINEIKLLLAGKRTSLATLRTGIAVFVLPLSVLSILVATSQMYDVIKVLHLLIPLLVLTTGLVVLGIYLIHRSVMHVRRYERTIHRLKKKNRHIADLCE